MTDAAISSVAATPPARRDIGIKRRYAAEQRFRFYGIAAIAVGVFFLFALLWSVVGNGYTAFWQTSIQLPITFDAEIIDPDNEREANPRALLTANYPRLAQQAIIEQLDLDPENRQQVRQAGAMISNGVRTQLRNMVVADPSIIGTTRDVWVLASADVDSALKGQVDLEVAEGRRKVSDQQVAWMRQMEGSGKMEQRLNSGLFTFGASSR